MSYSELYRITYPKGKPLGRKKSGVNRLRTVGVNLTQNEITQIDQLRGPATRSAFIRQVILNYLTDQAKGSATLP